MSSFALRLMELREQQEMKKSELAALLNVSPACISQYERGDSMPGYDILCKISQHFGVTTDYLLGNSSTEPLFDLNDPYCKGVKYNDLLVECRKVPNRNREMLIRIVSALQADMD